MKYDRPSGTTKSHRGSLSPMADGSAEAERVPMPDVTGMDVRDAKAILREAGIDAVPDGESPRVTGQLPPAGTTVQAGFCAMLYVTGETAPQAQPQRRPRPDKPRRPRPDRQQNAPAEAEAAAEQPRQGEDRRRNDRRNNRPRRRPKDNRTPQENKEE